MKSGESFTCVKHLKIRERFWVQAAAVFVLIAFVAQDMAYANPSPGFFQGAILKSFNQGIQDPVIHGQKIQLHPESGKIVRSFEGKQAASVFLIQDAHFHLEAQENASSAIKQLIEKFKIQFVGIEGVSGELWHDWATRFPDQSARDSVFRFLLEKHEIGAAEFALSQAKTNLPIRLFGLEDQNLYLRHLEIDREVRLRRDKIQKQLESWNRTLRGLISQVMPAEYLNYIATVNSQGDTVINWLKPLLDFARAQKVDLATYPQISGYSELENEMKGLDEVLLMRELRRIHDMDLRTGLLRLTLKADSDQIKWLETEMIQRGLQGGHPIVMQWLKLMSLSARLDENLVSEFRALDLSLRRSFLVTHEQIWLDRLSRWTDLMSAWEKLEWAPEDAARYEREHAEFFSKAALGKIEQLVKKHPVDTDAAEWQKLFRAETWAPWFQFYVLALKRDAVLAANTAKMVQMAGNRTVLIYAGGFHTPGLERALRERSISFVTIRPAIHREQDSTERVAYEKALDGNLGFFEKILKQSLAAARRSQRIPFELASQRFFPALGGGALTGAQTIFVNGVTTLLAMATISQTLALGSLNFSDAMAQDSVSWWSGVRVVSLTKAGKTTQGAVATPSGLIEFRTRDGDSGNGFTRLPGMTSGFRFDGAEMKASDLAQVKNSSPEVGAMADGFADLLPAELRNQRTAEQIVRSEIRKSAQAQLATASASPLPMRRPWARLVYAWFFALAALMAFSASAVAATSDGSTRSHAVAAAQAKLSEKVATGLSKLGVSFFERGRVKGEVAGGKKKVTVRRSVLGLPIGTKVTLRVPSPLRATIAKLEHPETPKSQAQSLPSKKSHPVAKRNVSRKPAAATSTAGTPGHGVATKPSKGPALSKGGDLRAKKKVPAQSFVAGTRNAFADPLQSPGGSAAPAAETPAKPVIAPPAPGTATQPNSAINLDEPIVSFTEPDVTPRANIAAAKGERERQQVAADAGVNRLEEIKRAEAANAAALAEKLRQEEIAKKEAWLAAELKRQQNAATELQKKKEAGVTEVAVAEEVSFWRKIRAAYSEWKLQEDAQWQAPLPEDAGWMHRLTKLVKHSWMAILLGFVFTFFVKRVARRMFRKKVSPVVTPTMAATSAGVEKYFPAKSLNPSQMNAKPDAEKAERQVEFLQRLIEWKESIGTDGNPAASADPALAAEVAAYRELFDFYAKLQQAEKAAEAQPAVPYVSKLAAFETGLVLYLTFHFLHIPVTWMGVLIAYVLYAIGKGLKRFLNELGHTLTAALKYRNSLTPSNLIGNKSVWQWLLETFFFFVFPDNLPSVHVTELQSAYQAAIDQALQVGIVEGEAQKQIRNLRWWDGFIRHGGFCGGVVLASVFIGAIVVAMFAGAPIVLFGGISPLLIKLGFCSLVLGMVTGLLIAINSDYLSETKMGIYNCGIVGFIVPAAESSLIEVWRDLWEMIRTLDPRGSQAIGIFWYMSGRFVGTLLNFLTPFNGAGILSKNVNPKRADLATVGMIALILRFLFAGLFMVADVMYVVIAHVRFSTTAPDESATQPHTWILPTLWNLIFHRELSFKLRDGKITEAHDYAETIVVHNGDLNGFWLRLKNRAAKYIAYGKKAIHNWLNALLAWVNRNKGDTVNISGLFKVFFTQGNFKAAVRLAYLQLLAKDESDLLLNKELKRMQQAFVARFRENKEVIQQIIDKDLDALLASETSFSDLSNRAVDQIAAIFLKGFPRTDAFRKIPANQWDEFVRLTVRHFLKDDLFHAMQQIAAKDNVDLDDPNSLGHEADGTFGLAVGSPRAREMVFYSYSQPVVFMFDEKFRRFRFASERTVLNSKPYRYRLSLKKVEIARVSWTQDGKISFQVFRPEMGNYRLVPREDVESAMKDTWEDKYAAARPDPNVTQPNEENLAKIAADAKRIKDEMRNESSDNYQVAGLVAGHAKYLAQRYKEGALSSATHYLIYATESSKQLAEVLKAELEILFPGPDPAQPESANRPKLNIEVVYADKLATKASRYVHHPEEFRKDFGISADDTMIISISQSGRTFEGDAMLQWLGTFVRNGVAILGDRDNEMADYLGQGRVLSTGTGGMQIAESRTHVNSAMHVLINELTLRIGREVLAEYPHAFGSVYHEPVYELKAGTGEIDSSTGKTALDKTRELVDISVGRFGKITGTDADGKAVNSLINQVLKLIARQRAQDALEGFVVTILTFGIFALAVQFGWLIYPSLVLKALGVWAAAAPALLMKLPLLQLILIKAAAISAMPIPAILMNLAFLYFFGRIVVTRLWRAAQIGVYHGAKLFGMKLPFAGRPLRFRSGSPKIFIADNDQYTQILDSTFSKMLALGYKNVPTIISAPANQLNHLVGQKAARGDIVIMGQPREEVLKGGAGMSGVQARGNRSFKAGVHVIVIGHHVNENPDGGDQFIDLEDGQINGKGTPQGFQDTPQELRMQEMKEQAIDSLERSLAVYVFATAYSDAIANPWYFRVFTVWLEKTPVLGALVWFIKRRFPFLLHYFPNFRTHDGTNVDTTASPTDMTTVFRILQAGATSGRMRYLLPLTLPNEEHPRVTLPHEAYGDHYLLDPKKLLQKAEMVEPASAEGSHQPIFSPGRLLVLATELLRGADERPLEEILSATEAALGRGLNGNLRATAEMTLALMPLLGATAQITHKRRALSAVEDRFDEVRRRLAAELEKKAGIRLSADPQHVELLEALRQHGSKITNAAPMAAAPKRKRPTKKRAGEKPDAKAPKPKRKTGAMKPPIAAKSAKGPSKKRSEFRDLSAALAPAVAFQSQMEIDAPTRRLQSLLAQAAKLEASGLGISSLARTQGIVLLVNPDTALVEAMNDQAPAKNLVLFFDSTVTVADFQSRKTALSRVRAEWIHATQPWMTLQSTVRDIQARERITNEDLVAIHDSFALRKLLPSTQSNQLIAQLLGAEAQRLMIFGAGVLSWPGVHEKTIDDLLEEMVATHESTADSA